MLLLLYCNYFKSNYVIIACIDDSNAKNNSSLKWLQGETWETEI